MSGWIGAWGNAATVTNLTVTGSQVISVNTSTDALRITQTGAGNALLVEDSANPDSSPFVVNTDGRVGIGTISLSGFSLRIGRAMTGATTTTSAVVQATVQSDVTNTAYLWSTYPSTQAASFNLTDLRHYDADQGTIGAGSTVTNQFGFRANATLTGATNNYGFYSNIASGTGRYNFYAAGTADNYFAGNTYTMSGTTTMTNGFFYIPSAAGAPTGVPTAVSGRVPMYYDTTNNNFYVYNGAWKKVLLG